MSAIKEYILHIETATDICSVALSNGPVLIEERKAPSGRRHSELTTVLIDAILCNQNISIGQLSAVCVSKGPGSYTGLRVAYSVAKGLCYSLDIPLIEVSTLQSLAMACTPLLEKPKKDHLILPMIDARRMEAYIAIYDQNSNLVLAPTAHILTDQSFSNFYQKEKLAYIYICGDAAEKALKVLPKEKTKKIDVFCDAKHLVLPAYRHFKDQKFSNLTVVEPFYLKSPNITKSTKNLL